MQYSRFSPPPPDLFVKWDTNSTEGSCVEIAHGPEGWVAVRDSKDSSGPILRFTAAEWTSFKHGLSSGKLS